MISRRQLLIIGSAVAAMEMSLMSALATSAAATVVTDFGNHMLQMLSDPQISPADRRDRFGTLLDRDFDLAKAGRFVLGRYWQSATDQEKKDFAVSLRGYLVKTYSARFAEFSNASFKVVGERSEAADSTVVSTTVTQTNKPQPAKVEWRVSTEGGSPKITDVIVDGVSMSITHRQEFAAMLKRNGGHVSELIAELGRMDDAGRR